MSEIQIVKVIEQGPQGAPAAEDVLAQVQTGIGAATADVAAYRTDAVLARNAAQSAQYASERAREQSQAAASTAAAVYGFLADSTTSLAITTGDKTFTIPTGKAFAPGMSVRASSKANPDTQALIGVVKSYSGTTLVIAVASAIGDATRADWTIAVTSGALAPIGATQDAQAIVQMARLERTLAAAGVSDEPVLILDFIRGVHFASRSAVTASIMALIAALPGSSFSRASTATYFDSDGLMKTAAVNVPRIDYDPVTRVCRGYLREPSRTNRFIQSGAPAHAAWTKNGFASTEPAGGLGPDGLASMTRMQEDAASSDRRMRQNINLVSGTTYCLSAIAREPVGNASKRYAVAAFPAAGFGAGTKVAVDLATGSWQSSGSVVSAGAKPLGNGLWRIWVSAVAITTATIALSFFNSYNPAGDTAPFAGDGSSAIDWGFLQCEEGSSPSSYIPTGASAVTRAVESLQIATTPWLNLAEGTVFVEFEAVQPVASNDFAFNLGTETLSDFIAVYRGSAGGGYVQSQSASVSQISSTANMPWPSTPAARAAVGWKANDAAWAWEGALAGSNNAYVVPLSTPFLLLSSSGAVNSMRLKRILIYPKRLPDTKLQALTNQSLWS